MAGVFKISTILTGGCVNKLSAEELEYELSIRGLPLSGNVDVKRKALRSALRLEKMGHSVEMIDHPFLFVTDLTALTKCISGIKGISDNWDGNGDDGTAARLSVKLCHALNRANRMLIVDKNQANIKQKNEVLIQIAELVNDCKHKVKTFEKTSTPKCEHVPLNLSQISLHDKSDIDTSSEDEGATNVSNNGEVIERKSSYVPVYKWGIKFAGRKGESINAFLRDVEELCRSRNVNKQQLLQSAPDLFTDVAKVWYRSNYQNFSTWEQLVAELKAEFQSPDYDDELFEQIKKRTQGPNESVGIFFSIMNTLFENLTNSIAEATKVMIIKRNIIPIYQNQLALHHPKTVNELKLLCKDLESCKASVDRFAPPKSNRHALEPELTLIDNNHQVRCYNCGQIGHYRGDCRNFNGNRHESLRVRSEIKCYGCGQPGVIKQNCSKCKGNGSRK